MSEFKVTLERIESVTKHPNADRLDIARIESMDYQFVVRSGQYKEGDLVIYFPVDSILNERTIEMLGLANMLSGGLKNRIKTVRLRGEISQGVVCDVATLFPTEPFDSSDNIRVRLDIPHSYDFASMIGVTKYEPKEVHSSGPNNARLITLPREVEVYDIESAQRYKKIIDSYKDLVWTVREKVEGTHISFLYNIDENTHNVCSRKMLVKNKDEQNYFNDPERGEQILSKNPYLEAAEDLGGFEALNKVFNLLMNEQKYESIRPKNSVILRGELIGPSVQNNIYGLKERKVLFFDIEVDSQYISDAMFESLACDAGLEVAPVVFRGVFNDFIGDSSFVDKSDGASEIKLDILREGIVARPHENEVCVEHFGRLIIKQRSPEYLAKSDL